MLIFDQFKKDDPQLRLLALAVAGGLAVLLAGLWWVQIVSARDYRENLENQSFRTVRIPAVRGKILDRNGTVLAENRPTYNLSLYLGELRDKFQEQYLRQRPMNVVTQSHWFGSPTVSTQFVRLKKEQNEALKWQARLTAASNVVTQLSQRLQVPLAIDPVRFQRHYSNSLVMPFPVLTNVTPVQLARFEEQGPSSRGVDLDLHSTRTYPFGATAAHVIGHLHFDDSSAEGEESFVSYRLPDYKGEVGIEAGLDKELRGKAGVKSVLINSLGYRQTENVWSPAEPGRNVVLTIDIQIQKAAEAALSIAKTKHTGLVRGAVVVMDVNTGDILAMASCPTFNPNSYVPKISTEELRHIGDLKAERNCATQEHYMPGSVFKTVVGLAALEAGWDPNKEVTVQPDPDKPEHGAMFVGTDHQKLRDTVSPGNYNFKRAIIKSSNVFFATVGLWVGPDRIIRLAQHLHFGERTGLNAYTHQEARGGFPKSADLNSGWNPGNTANMCIGQDPVWVTPLQVAVLASALANGGKVLWPRLVERIEPLDPVSGEPAQVFPPRPPRDELGVRPSNMRILHEAMLAETEDPEGTGKPATEHNPGLHICGKTGTAQVKKDAHGNAVEWTTWFASFAPFDKPRWAVVVMVEDGISGGTTCAPVAGEVYKALREREPKG